jgi:hypothetical protein
MEEKVKALKWEINRKTRKQWRWKKQEGIRKRINIKRKPGMRKRNYAWFLVSSDLHIIYSAMFSTKLIHYLMALG